MQTQVKNELEYYQWFLNIEKQRCIRNKRIVCILSIDFNQNGNPLIRKNKGRIIKLIQSYVRQSDAIFNFDEKVHIILTDTDKEGAYLVAKRILNGVQKKCLSDGHFILNVKIWDFNAKIQFKTFMYNQGWSEPWRLIATHK
ncbi:MAG: hypothetical protein D6813_14535 [Calditrichaeota bacterium]|nr:MAG: hypothetical protein D6813_14535 [Calditrichota bacterium]